MTLVLLLAACASCSRPPTQPVDAGVDGLDARLADRADLAPIHAFIWEHVLSPLKLSP